MDFTPCVAPPRPVIPRDSLELRTISVQKEEAMFTLIRRSCLCVPYIRARGRGNILREQRRFVSHKSPGYYVTQQPLRLLLCAPRSSCSLPDVNSLAALVLAWSIGSRGGGVAKISSTRSTCSLKAPNKAHNFPFQWRPLVLSLGSPAI